MINLTFDEDEKFGTDKWERKMLANGNILQANKVCLVLLVHGTFVGDDPLGISNMLEPINKTLADTLRKKQKALINDLAKDIGNYTSEYREALSNTLSIPCELVTWSSGNYHLARLKGVVELAQILARKVSAGKIQSDNRILILGHSHAGQLFALLTSFLANDQRAQRLYAIMNKYGELREDKEELIKGIEKINGTNLDFVTFGTPVRYAWGEYEKFRLMAIVNHRSNVRLSGLLSTRDGDYVQQWGVEGTDMLPEGIEGAINDEFDTVLDEGRAVSLLINNLKREERRNPKYTNGQIVTETFLVNYKDNAQFPILFLNPFSIPHCIKTLFGHGVYTRESVMLFNMNTIVKNLY